MRTPQFIQKFLALESASSILLALATLLALFLANSSLHEAYEQVLRFSLYGLTVHHWINDGLMTIFFFVVGMEIKNELAVGELSSTRKAALPMVAALGGMVVPALVYVIFNTRGSELRGWGIPMATDIAFAVGVLSLFGKRVPLALKVFLLALAIVDDLGAVLVIALFYTQEISGLFLAGSASIFILVTLARLWGVRSTLPYWVLGSLAWYCCLRSGVHATVAGVILGFLTPVSLGERSGKVRSPLRDLVHTLHPAVNFGIMPIFALANAGVDLRSLGLADLLHPVSTGVGLGLFLGKPIGIALFSFLATAFGLGELPKGVRWTQLLGVGALGGIGFTMALFISSLALPPEMEIYSKAGILGGSILAALVGALVLSFALPKKAAA